MSRLVLMATGDVAPRRDDLASMFAGVTATLNGADLVFGQLETVISDRGEPAPQARLAMRTAPAAAAAIRAGGYDVMSFAGNHCLDWGSAAFADTLAHADAAGLTLCGAGADLSAARAPAIVEANGIRMALLAYSSILPAGYEATDRRAGCAPMRAFTTYEQIELDQPGTPPRVHTHAHPGDLADLEADVRAAQAAADLVFVSIHWGIHFVPSEIAAYQRQVAHAAIAAGADGLFGHHPHMLKGIEMIAGRPVFYSLGNFAIEQPQAFDETVLESKGFAEISALNPAFDKRRAYIAPPDSQKSMIAVLTIEDGRVARVAYRPVQIADTAEPEVLTRADPRWTEIAAYVERISREQDLAVRFEAEGDEVLVLPG